MQAGKERRGVGGLCQLQFSDGHLLTMEFKAYVILLFFFSSRHQMLPTNERFNRNTRRRDEIIKKCHVTYCICNPHVFFFVRKHTVSQECEIQLLNCNSVTKGWCCWMFQSLCSIGACQWLYMKMKDKPTQTGFKNNDKILHHRQCPLLSAWFWAVKKSSDHQNDQVTSCFTASNN